MIGTHIPKMFNPVLKQRALRARIIKPESDVVSSATTRLRRELWACPSDAAQMGKYRALVSSASEDSFEPDIPDVSDPQLKQILVPGANWQGGEYVTTTPLASAGLAHEVYHRLREWNLPSKRWLVQPTPVALSNHGETLLMQAGVVRLLRRGAAKIKGDITWLSDERIVALSGRVERMNIASGLVSIGLPAITSIGGLVHAIERRIGAELDFAIGLIDSPQWVQSALHTVSRGSYTTLPRAKEDRIRAGQVYGFVTPQNGYKRDNIQANGRFMLMLRGSGRPLNHVRLKMLVNDLSTVTRLAGGSIFDAEVKVIERGMQFASPSFIIDASDELRDLPPGADALGAALGAYGRDGMWRSDRSWFQHRNGYSLSMSGYAWLEEPRERRNCRDNYPHVWSESIFSLVTQGTLTNMAWWRRHVNDGGVRWKMAGYSNAYSEAILSDPQISDSTGVNDTPCRV